MTFFDFLKELNDTAKERLKTPIIGAFVFSFVIYNWRPIVELCFSKVAIEDRIYIIEQEYCNKWAIIIPLGIALFYTIVVPLVMLGIDWLLEPIKRMRIGRIYKSKDYVTDEKIKLARKQFELKNVETGNKQIEDFQAQIKELEISKEQIIKANNLKMDEMNSSFLKIAESHENNAKNLEVLTNKMGKELKEAHKLTKLLVNLNNEDYAYLKAISKKELTDEQLMNSKVIKKLSKLELIIVSGGIIHLSEFGNLVVDTTD